MDHADLDRSGEFGHDAIDNLMRSRVPVTAFGAKGDGVKDDTAAIQRAIAYAESNGGSVFLPAGTFLVSTLYVSRPVTVSGAGFGSKLLLRAGVNDSVISSTGASHLVFQDFAIDGNKANQGVGYSDGLHLESVTLASCRNLLIADCQDGGVHPLSASNVTVEGCFLYRNENHVVAHASSFCRVVGNYCEGSTLEALTSYDQSDGSGLAHHNVFAGNTVRGGWGGIVLQRSWANTVSGNAILDCTHYGISAYGDTAHSHDNTITGNAITGGGDGTGAIALRADQLSVDNVWSGNIVTDWAGKAADVRASFQTFTGNRINTSGIFAIMGAHDIDLIGNTIRGSLAQGVYIDGAGGSGVYNLRVHDNTISGCQQDGLKTFATTAALRDSSFVNNTVFNNGQATANTYDGIYFGGSVERIAFRSNRCFDDQSTKTQRKGVRFKLDGTTTYTSSGNDLRRNLSLPDAFTAVPTAGTWTTGDRFEFSAPVNIGGVNYTGCICTAGGSPGTWKGYGAVEA